VSRVDRTLHRQARGFPLSHTKVKGTIGSNPVLPGCGSHQVHQSGGGGLRTNSAQQTDSRRGSVHLVLGITTASVLVKSEEPLSKARQTCVQSLTARLGQLPVQADHGYVAEFSRHVSRPQSLGTTPGVRSRVALPISPFKLRLCVVLSRG
jgi:hypothetical protein